VAPPRPGKPVNTAAVGISGTLSAGEILSCSPGSWTNSPTRYTYQWFRDGTPVQSATSEHYTVAGSDEGTTLTCEITASNAKGASSPITSEGVTIPVPHVRGCPPATGALSGTTLGLVRLGMTSKQAHRAYAHSSTRGFDFKDFFCLTPQGVRVGYGSPKLLKTLPAGERAKFAGRVVWASTSNARYAVNGIRAGAALALAKEQLPHGYQFRLGLNDWYLARAAGVTAVLKVRHGLIEEIGLADQQLTGSHDADRELMASFF
jgi:hypothetical protein